MSGKPDGDGAQLKALVPLDRENSQHKDGLRFQVQVTDQVSQHRIMFGLFNLRTLFILAHIL